MLKGAVFLSISLILVSCAVGYEIYAFDELKKLDPSLTNRVGLEPGVFRAASKLSFLEFSEKVRLAKPIFTRHIQPVDEMIPIARSKNDLEQFIDLFLSHSNRIHPGMTIAVQVRRKHGTDYGYTAYGVKEALDPFITEQGAVSVIQHADLILSLYLTEKDAYFGISSPVDNLSDWPGGAIRFRRAENQVSRSRFKLEEACMVFGIQLEQYSDALDLGAAPGGWTSLLLDRGLHVTAVDTGELEAQFREHPHLTFLKTNAADVQLPENSFDVLTCDMSWDPIHTAQIVHRLAHVLKQDGIAILTIKFMHKKILKTINDFLRRLEPDFRPIQVKQLFHNRDEATAYLMKQ